MGEWDLCTGRQPQKSSILNKTKIADILASVSTPFVCGSWVVVVEVGEGVGDRGGVLIHLVYFPMRTSSPSKHNSFTLKGIVYPFFVVPQ